MRYWLLAGLALVLCWLQVYFLGWWRPWGIVPNLLAVVVILAGLRTRVTDTLWLALVAGLLLDLSSGADFGLRMAFYSLLALLVAVLARLGVDFDNLGLLIVMLLIGTLIYNVAVVSNLVLAGGIIGWKAFATKTGLEFGLNVLILLLLWPLANRLGRSSHIPQVKLGGWGG